MSSTDSGLRGIIAPARRLHFLPPFPASLYDTEVNDIEKEIVDARIFGGMHFRHSDMNGAQLGRKVAKNLVANFFRPAIAVK